MTHVREQDETRYEGPVMTMELCPLVKQNIYARAKELMLTGEHPLVSCIEMTVREYFPGWIVRWIGFALKIYHPERPKSRDRWDHLTKIRTKFVDPYIPE